MRYREEEQFVRRKSSIFHNTCLLTSLCMSAVTLSGKGKNDNLSGRNRGGGCDYEILNDPVLGTLYIQMTLARGLLARGLFMVVH